jgi:hypothetical protein
MGMMSEREDLLVNPNTASVGALTRLPGIGEVLAQRIIEARPYSQAEELLRVPGLGEATLSRFSSFLDFGGEVVPGEKAEGIEPTLEVPEDKEREPERLPRSARGKPIREKVVYSREAVLWWIVGAAVISVALSVILSLSILAGINRTLDFGRHATIRQLTGDLATIEADLRDVSSRIDAIGRRIEAVEGLSGRVTEVEREISLIHEEVRGSLDEINSIRGIVDGLSQEVSHFSERVGVFDSFLNGLRELLAGISPTTTP